MNDLSNRQEVARSTTNNRPWDENNFLIRLGGQRKSEWRIGEALPPDEKEWCRGWPPSEPWPASKDVAESWRVRNRVHAVPKQCWFNARKTVLMLDEYADSSYVRGWAILKCGMPIEHGWVVRGDTIIDPTLPEMVTRYFPGLEFQGRSEIVKFLTTPRGKKCGRSPCFFAFGWGGMHHPGMRRALEEANAIMYEMADQNDPGGVVA